MHYLSKHISIEFTEKKVKSGPVILLSSIVECVRVCVCVTVIRLHKTYR